MTNNDHRLSNTNEAFRLLNAGEVASILNISLGFAYQLMKRGDVPTIHLGRAVRVRPVDLELYIEKNAST